MAVNYFSGLADLGGGFGQGMESAQKMRRLAIMPEVEQTIYEQFASGAPDYNVIRGQLARVGEVGIPNTSGSATLEMRQQMGEAQADARRRFASAYEQWLPMAGAQELLAMGYQGDDVAELQADVSAQAQERERLFNEMVNADADNAAAGGSALITVTIRQAPRQWAQQRIQSGIQYRRTGLREKAFDVGREDEYRKSRDAVVANYKQIQTDYRNATTKANLVPAEFDSFKLGSLPKEFDSDRARELGGMVAVARQVVPQDTKGISDQFASIVRGIFSPEYSNIDTLDKMQQVWTNLNALISSKDAIKAEMLKNAEEDKAGQLKELVSGTDARLRAELLKAMNPADKAIAETAGAGVGGSGTFETATPMAGKQYQGYTMPRRATSLEDLQ